ncbi:MAG: peptidylprolyl isomerase [Moraxellaceae bacterium]|jgi:peptidyl-prolyl cis-trans isomerase D|nr:peptidylprolyl isomerase [Moraxellaceae bacterium]
MDAFREMVKGWLGKALLTFVLLIMAVTGIEMYFTGSSVTAASVNGTDISQADLDKLVDRQRQQMMAQMGANQDPAALDVRRIREDVLNGMISRELLVQEAGKQGFLVSDATVHKLIREVPSFQEEGKFSQRLYEQAIRQIGENPATYPARAKQELSYSMLVAGIGQSGLVTLPELERLSALNMQQRDLHFAVVPAARFLAGLSVSDDEVKQYYGAHPDRFTTPETVSLEYLTLKREDFLDAAAPTDEDLRARYEERVNAISSNEQRRSQHILVATDEKTKEADALKRIQEIEKRARAGEDFGKLAKEFSQDPGSVASGGDLGLAGRGMFAPEFEQALFSLKEGEISAPVKTQYGYHLIRLNKVERADVPSFASLKPQLEKEVREVKADELFSETSEKLDAAVYEASDLKEPADRFKLLVSATEPFTRAGGTGLAADRKIVEVAFSDELLNEGKNSTGMRLADGAMVWIRVKQHLPAKLLPLTDMAADVRNQLMLDKAKEKAKATAAAVKESLGKGESLEAVAARHGLSWQNVPGATRRTQLPSPELLRVAYRLPHPAAGKVTADSLEMGTSFVVVAVSKVTPGQPAAEAELAQIRNVLSESRSQQEFQDYVAFLRKSSDVQVRQDKSAAE